MEQYGNESHVCKFAVVSDYGASFRRHQVSSEEAEFCVMVFLLQAVHKTRGVKVAAGFSYNKIVFHRFQLFICSIISYAVTSMVVGVMAT